MTPVFCTPLVLEVHIPLLPPASCTPVKEHIGECENKEKTDPQLLSLKKSYKTEAAKFQCGLNKKSQGELLSLLEDLCLYAPPANQQCHHTIFVNL